MKATLLALFLLLSPPSWSAADFIQCYDFGCKSRVEVNFSKTQWASIEQLFRQTQHVNVSEKQAIRQAVAMMEQYSGEMTGTSLDKGGNYPGYEITGQMDCIDESTNTFQYLTALEARKLLTSHRTRPKKRRIVWLFTHWTAVIEDISTQKMYAVDSWYLDNGEPPYIQPLEDWQKKRPFSKEYNLD